MKIVVASGKGGTGKTTIATGLALSMAGEVKVRVIDCDVEAPDGHLFLKPSYLNKVDAIIHIPNIQVEKCTVCGRCVEICQYHALVKVGKTIMVFPQLCHGCGSCTWNCPQKAIIEDPRPIGVLEQGRAKNGIQYYRGLLTISEPMPTPVIRQLKQWIVPSDNSLDILDAPPGASCSVVETLRGVDFVLLVTEPTPFGLHDLKQMVDILKEMNIPAGIIVNRDGIGGPAVEDFCKENNLPILLRIPFDRLIAEGLAEGKPLVEISPQYVSQFKYMFTVIKEMA